MVTLPDTGKDWVYFLNFHPFNGTSYPVYLATENVFFDKNDPDAPNREYLGLIIGAISKSAGIDVAGGAIKADGQPDYGGVTVAMDDWFFFSAEGLQKWKTSAWDGYPYELLRGVRPADGQPWRYADLERVHLGVTAGGNTYGSTEVIIQVGGFSERLRKMFAKDQYPGEGAFGGGDDLKDQVKCRAIGKIIHAPARLIDPEDEWWDFATIDGFHTFLKAYQGGFEYEEDATSPPAPGKIFVDAENGRIQTRGFPALPITASFISGFGDGAVTMADTVRALLVDAGFEDAEIDDDTFDALNAANSAPIGIYVSATTPYQDLIDKILGSDGAFHGESNGKFQVFRFEPPTATTPDEADLLVTDVHLVRAEYKERPQVIPPYRLDMNFAPLWTSFSVTDLAEEADNEVKTYLLSAWRTKSHTDSTTEAWHKNSQPKSMESYFTEKADAATAVARLGAFLCVMQSTVDAPIAAVPFGLKPNAQIWVQSSFNNTNCAYRVVNVKDQHSSARVDTTIWRNAA